MRSEEHSRFIPEVHVKKENDFHLSGAPFKGGNFSRRCARVPTSDSLEGSRFSPPLA